LQQITAHFGHNKKKKTTITFSQMFVNKTKATYTLPVCLNNDNENTVDEIIKLTVNDYGLYK